MRQGAVWIPDWPVTAAEMAGLVPVDTPAAVVGSRGVVAANAWARTAGVMEGMKKRIAHALCPELVDIPVDTGRDVQRFEPVLRALDRHIARVTVVEPGSVLFAARGAIRTAGSVEKLAEAIVGEIADIAGCESHVGFAEGTLATLLAARHDGVVTAGESQRYLMGQRMETVLIAVSSPTQRADIAECIELCERLGVRSIGDVLALGSTALTTRFGETGALIWQLASGHDIRVSNAVSLIEDFHCSRPCEPALVNTEQATFAVKELAGEVSEEMGFRGAGGGRLTITAFLENGEQYARSWHIEGGGEKDIVDRTRWQLDAWMASPEEGSGIVRLELMMSDLIPVGFRPEPLWGGRSVHAEQAARSASRLQTMMGEDEVRMVQYAGGRIPLERYRSHQWNEVVVQGNPVDAPWPGAIPDPAPAVLHPQGEPRELQGKCGHSLGVRGDGQLICSQCGDSEPGLLSGKRIENFAGPWIVEQRWWDRPTRRAYLQVIHEDAARLVYCEGGHWYEEGRYD